MSEGQQLTVYGDGGQTRDYVFVRDVARANMLATQWWLDDPNTIDDTAFNIGTALETSVNELAQTLIDAVGADVSIAHAPERAGELRRSAVAIDRAARDLDWKPQVALSDGLKQTYEWITENAA
jgi:UDP-glucose 4-epimerase